MSSGTSLDSHENSLLAAFGPSTESASATPTTDDSDHFQPLDVRDSDSDTDLSATGQPRIDRTFSLSQATREICEAPDLHELFRNWFSTPIKISYRPDELTPILSRGEILTTSFHMDNLCTVGPAGAPNFDLIVEEETAVGYIFRWCIRLGRRVLSLKGLMFGPSARAFFVGEIVGLVDVYWVLFEGPEDGLKSSRRTVKHEVAVVDEGAAQILRGLLLDAIQDQRARLPLNNGLLTGVASNFGAQTVWEFPAETLACIGRAASTLWHDEAYAARLGDLKGQRAQLVCIRYGQDLIFDGRRVELLASRFTSVLKLEKSCIVQAAVAQNQRIECPSSPVTLLFKREQVRQLLGENSFSFFTKAWLHDLGAFQLNAMPRSLAGLFDELNERLIAICQARTMHVNVQGYSLTKAYLRKATSSEPFYKGQITTYTSAPLRQIRAGGRRPQALEESIVVTMNRTDDVTGELENLSNGIRTELNVAVALQEGVQRERGDGSVLLVGMLEGLSDVQARAFGIGGANPSSEMLAALVKLPSRAYMGYMRALLSLLRSFFERVMERHRRNGSTSVEELELIAVMERLAQFAFSGDVRKLPKQVLTACGAIETLRLGSFPCLGTQLFDLNVLRALFVASWPSDGDGAPILYQLVSVAAGSSAAETARRISCAKLTAQLVRGALVPEADRAQLVSVACEKFFATVAFPELAELTLSLARGNRGLLTAMGPAVLTEPMHVMRGNAGQVLQRFGYVSRIVDLTPYCGGIVEEAVKAASSQRPRGAFCRLQFPFWLLNLVRVTDILDLDAIISGSIAAARALCLTQMIDFRALNDNQFALVMLQLEEDPGQLLSDAVAADVFAARARPDVAVMAWDSWRAVKAEVHEWSSFYPTFPLERILGLERANPSLHSVLLLKSVFAAETQYARANTGQWELVLRPKSRPSYAALAYIYAAGILFGHDGTTDAFTYGRVPRITGYKLNAWLMVRLRIATGQRRGNGWNRLVFLQQPTLEQLARVFRGGSGQREFFVALGFENVVVNLTD